MPNEERLKKLYNTVMAQAISESGRYLFVGNLFGDIFVQDISEFEKTEEPLGKLLIFPQGKDVKINSLCFHRSFLLIGAVGVIYGLKWHEEKLELSNQWWVRKLPMRPDQLEASDVNHMLLVPELNILYAGCGDNVIYQFDLDYLRVMREFTGHTDYIHGVAGFENGRIFSASEDGTVRFWCKRQKKPTATIEPNTKPELTRSEFGKWIGTVAVYDDWLVCGGGPQSSVWHIPSYECAKVLPYPGKVHVCDFIDNHIIVGGEHKCVKLYSLNGDFKASIPVDHTASYSIVHQLKPTKFISIAGYSNNLSISTDFHVLERKIELYGNTK